MLARCDIESLEQATAEKTALIAALESQSGNFCHLDDDDNSEVKPRLLELARRCLHANRINGGAIELSRAVTGKLVETLYGAVGSASGGTVYGDDGRLNTSAPLLRGMRV